VTEIVVIQLHDIDVIQKYQRGKPYSWRNWLSSSWFRRSEQHEQRGGVAIKFAYDLYIGGERDYFHDLCVRAQGDRRIGHLLGYEASTQT
jgi:hypothetical protein